MISIFHIIISTKIDNFSRVGRARARLIEINFAFPSGTISREIIFLNAAKINFPDVWRISN